MTTVYDLKLRVDGYSLRQARYMLNVRQDFKEIESDIIPSHFVTDLNYDQDHFAKDLLIRQAC